MTRNQISDYTGTVEEDAEIARLLRLVYVDGGHTDADRAEKSFAPEMLRKRGEMILARSSVGKLLGMVICASPVSELRQIAGLDEAEVQLLAVHPDARELGVGTELMAACEDRALVRGYRKIVLSTQPTMTAAHRLYERLGYQRNAARDWSFPGRSFLVYEKALKPQLA